MTKWEYVTVPVLVHVTKQILDQWGEDGWELSIKALIDNADCSHKARFTLIDADGNEIGQRTASKMRFRLNLLNIRIGVTVHLWNKKANKA